MRFLHPERDALLELALEDVFLVPQRFEGSSRLDTDLTPLDFEGGSHPVVAANMNAVTGKRMAETMARFGGLGVLPQDMHLDVVDRIVRHIKAADPRYDTPLSVSPDATLHDVDGIMRKRAHGMVIVVDDERRPVGIVAPADLRDRDHYSPVRSFMQHKVVTVEVGATNREAFLRMHEERVKSVPVLDREGRLCGVLTRELYVDEFFVDLTQPSEFVAFVAREHPPGSILVHA
jgi:IMP dehydrogenase